MGKPKNTKVEVKEKRRLAARQRRERIKNDPVLYQQSKEKEKERYNKRKRDKKLFLSAKCHQKTGRKLKKEIEKISELTIKDKRKRENWKQLRKK